MIARSVIFGLIPSMPIFAGLCVVIIIPPVQIANRSMVVQWRRQMKVIAGGISHPAEIVYGQGILSFVHKLVNTYEWRRTSKGNGGEFYDHNRKQQWRMLLRAQFSLLQ